jgi:hypothetical protein
MHSAQNATENVTIYKQRNTFFIYPEIREQALASISTTPCTFLTRSNCHRERSDRDLSGFGNPKGLEGAANELLIYPVMGDHQQFLT